MKSGIYTWAGQLAAALTLALAPAAQAQEALGQNDQIIHDVARMGKGEEIARIIKANPAMRDARTGLGSTPLHMAATNPDTGALKALLAAGADVNAKDMDGNTPLHMAAYSNKFEHSKLLLEAGADVNAVSTGGRTPVAMARKSRADDVIGLISLWMLKGCKAGEKCIQAENSNLQKLLD
ncbi:MAG: ankyrin repeat domain-containing protein [Sulfurimicrobium sp.]|nr:ankyrin repeat domain-containing protein [Sulfurimicrobium sp.]MDP2962766.1 ankyrin repeat domain-containing protein [Sulfurimicrobium sp.]